MGGSYQGTKALWNMPVVQKDLKENPQRITDFYQAYGGMCTPCFVAGTKITMCDFSNKNIEDVQLGDTIKTFNFQTSILENNIVLEVVSPIHDDIIMVKFSNNTTIECTQAHPFYVKGKGWASYSPSCSEIGFNLIVNQLEKGDLCYIIKDEQISEVEITGIIETPRQVKTYNLMKITNSDNYFVNGILVHNESENQE